MRTRQLYRTRTIWLLAALLLIAAGLFFIAGCGGLGSLAGVVRQAVTGRAVEYQLDGTAPGP